MVEGHHGFLPINNDGLTHSEIKKRFSHFWKESSFYRKKEWGKLTDIKFVKISWTLVTNIDLFYWWGTEERSLFSYFDFLSENLLTQMIAPSVPRNLPLSTWEYTEWPTSCCGYGTCPWICACHCRPWAAVSSFAGSNYVSSRLNCRQSYSKHNLLRSRQTKRGLYHIQLVLHETRFDLGSP